MTSAGPPSSPPPYPGKSRRADGMTWTALVVLLLLVAFMGWNIYTWNEARTPPSGAGVSAATVDDTFDPSRPRPGAGSRTRNFLVVQFHLADGEEGEALYEQRFLGGAEAGDTISVYRDGDEWRTTSEESPWGAIFSGLGILVLLVLVFGWWKVRREPKRPPPPRTPIARDGPGGI